MKQRLIRLGYDLINRLQIVTFISTAGPWVKFLFFNAEIMTQMLGARERKFKHNALHKYIKMGKRSPAHLHPCLVP